jgi:hypothetical protein
MFVIFFDQAILFIRMFGSSKEKENLLVTESARSRSPSLPDPISQLEVVWRRRNLK